MEATIFTGWIYDHLLPHAEQVKVAHPLMLRAIAAAKTKNDQIDASKIADCLRCDFLPECHMASTQIRDRRRTLRYRHLLVRQMVQMKNPAAEIGLLDVLTPLARRHLEGGCAGLVSSVFDPGLLLGHNALSLQRSRAFILIAVFVGFRLLPFSPQYPIHALVKSIGQQDQHL